MSNPALCDAMLDGGSAADRRGRSLRPWPRPIGIFGALLSFVLPPFPSVLGAWELAKLAVPRKIKWCML